MGFDGVTIKKSALARPQFDDGLGVFADRDFEKGEAVIKWSLKTITEEEYEGLPERGKRQFTHKRDDIIYYYGEPERHVNRSKYPNAFPDFEKNADIAIKHIKKGEEITILDTVREDS